MNRRLLLTSLLAAALAACSGDDGGGTVIDASTEIDALVIDAAPRQVIMENQSLQPGELVEGIMTGGPQDVAVIHLEAPVAELDWNIHGHQNGSTQTVYEELNRMVADYVFVPTSDTDWWLLLRNSGPTDMTITVRVELYGDMQWRWQ
ncbi:MAG TPA: hypothetical protein VM261_01580 [Kofleriaceae bacterium]|nr:hypothetical protein [Kofleriaceae bacterium]